MVSSTETIIRFKAFYDADADVWVATSDDLITAEATTPGELSARLSTIVPDVLDSRAVAPGPFRIVIDWQELRTFDQTSFATFLKVVSCFWHRIATR